jgi:hypothetical protein
MTVSEVARHRAYVALVHSRYLHQHPAIRQQWMDVVDTLAAFVDLIPSHGARDLDVHTGDLIGRPGRIRRPHVCGGWP